MELVLYIIIMHFLVHFFMQGISVEVVQNKKSNRPIQKYWVYSLVINYSVVRNMSNKYSINWSTYSISNKVFQSEFV